MLDNYFNYVDDCSQIDKAIALNYKRLTIYLTYWIDSSRAIGTKPRLTIRNILC